MRCPLPGWGSLVVVTLWRSGLRTGREGSPGLRVSADRGLHAADRRAVPGEVRRPARLLQPGHAAVRAGGAVRRHPDAGRRPQRVRGRPRRELNDVRRDGERAGLVCRGQRCGAGQCCSHRPKLKNKKVPPPRTLPAFGFQRAMSAEYNVKEYSVMGLLKEPPPKWSGIGRAVFFDAPPPTL